MYNGLVPPLLLLQGVVTCRPWCIKAEDETVVVTRDDEIIGAGGSPDHADTVVVVVIIGEDEVVKKSNMLIVMDDLLPLLLALLILVIFLCVNDVCSSNQVTTNNVGIEDGSPLSKRRMDNITMLLLRPFQAVALLYYVFVTSAALLAAFGLLVVGFLKLMFGCSLRKFKNIQMKSDTPKVYLVS
jgi:hypothetical protein